MKIFLLAALTAGIASAGSFTYADFSSTAGLTMNGATTTAGTALRLVPSVDSQAGTVFRSVAEAIDGSTAFHTAFEFLVQTDGASALGPPDGFTFLLHNDAAGAGALGGAGQGMGYFGLSPSVAVVFRGRGPAFIGVITGGIDPADLAVPFNPPGATAHTEGDFYETNQFAWIDYDPSTNILEVFLSATAAKPAAADMTTTVNLAGTLGSQAYVGFSAGNGGAFGSQDILNWNFTTSQVPEPGTAGILAAGLLALGVARRRMNK